MAEMMDKSVSNATDPEILAEIGRRLRALRKARNMTIEDVARATDLDRSTISRAEHGDNATLLTVLRLLRAYGRLGAIEGFIPEPEISPMELIRRRKRKRRRGVG